MSIVGAQHSVDEPAVSGTHVWLTTAPVPPSTADLILQMSFETPIEIDAASRSGRVDFSDMHVAIGLGASAPDVAFPNGCVATPTLSAQQRMWEFMFFDTARCVGPDRQ